MGTEQQIVQYRQAIAAAIEKGEDASSAAGNLLYNNAPLSAKFIVIDFCTLLRNNSQSPASMKKLLNALNILEKYGRHLLKPPGSRSNMWRHIKFSNAIFRDRVDVINGGRDIMYFMGYTVKKEDGVAFPDNGEPDHAEVMNLVTDIFYGRKELEAYLEKQHPNPAAIEEFISLELRRVLHEDLTGTNVAPSRGLSLPRHSPNPPQSVGRQPTLGSSLTEHSPSSNTPQSTSVGSHQPMSQLAAHSVGYPETNATQPSTNYSNVHPNVVSSYSHESFQPRVMTGQSLGHGRPDRQPVPVSREANVTPIASPAEETQKEELDLKTSGIVCDICGDNDADVICEVCDNKQLCKGCDTKWHNHPKRQNHKLTQLSAKASLLSAQGGQPTQHVTQREQHQVTRRLQPQQNVTQGIQPEQQVIQGGQSQQQAIQGRQPQQVRQGVQSQQQHVMQGGQPQQHERQFNQQNERFNQRQLPQMNERMNQGPQLHQQKEISQNQPIQQYQQNDAINQGTDSDQTHLVQMYGEQPSPHSNVRFNMPTPPLNPHMTMPSGNSGSPISDRNRPHFQYDPRTSHFGSISQGQTNIGISSSGMSEHMGAAQMASGYMYPQPNMMTPIPNMIYPSSIMQSGQPMTYGVIQGHVQGHVPQQYPVGYQPYMTTPNPHPMSMQPTNDRIQQRSDEMSANSPRTLPRTSSSRSSMSSPNDDFTRDSSSFPNTNWPDTGSSLLPTIKLIPDLEKRQARLQIHLMTLKDDLKEWEIRINDIILQNPNFFQDEEYMILNRKKRKHLQELKVLQNYENEINAELARNAEESQRQKEEYERALEVESLRKRSNLLRSNASESMFGASANVAHTNQPFQPQHTEKTHSNQSSSSSGLVPVGPVTTTYRRPEEPQSQTKVNTYQSADEESCPPLQLNSLGDDDGLSADIKRMLVLDQNPFGNRPTSSSQDFQVQGHPGSTNEAVAFPPNISGPNEQSQKISNVGIKKGKSAPDIHGGISQTQKTISKSHSSSAIQMWQCSHCTFMNDVNTKVCSMCSKTSDNPTIIPPNIPHVNDENTLKEACEVCTYFNEPGTKICEVCSSAQSKYDVIEAEVIRDSGAAGTDSDINAACQAAQDASVKSDRRDSSSARNLIEMEQDQVYQEKKAARERFEQMNAAQQAPVDLSQVMPVQQEFRDTGLAEAVPNESKFGVRESVSPQPVATSKHGELRIPTNKNLDRVRKVSGNDPSSGSSSSYNSAVSSFGESPKDESKVKVNEQGQVKGQKHPSSLNFVEAIEQINLKREQEQMILDGYNFMAELKEAERHGFEISEMEVALRYCADDNLSPLGWLKKKWSENIDIVVTMATGEGNKAEQNDVGEMSAQEAKSALARCYGDLEKATEMCVNERRRKYAEISAGSQYPREEILTALYQRCGDVEEVIDQLNHAVVQRFNDRLWESNGNGGGDAALAEAARMAELGNSVSNSVINHEEFRRVISDVNIDRERRVRMVFIEAKLRSWGRAETVITILDQEVTTSDTPLECDIEDIIEAVRNCGDRKSSLVYLKQECIVCFCLYPMSKIRNLGVCNCKLCTDCLQQYFEVAIREHFVRNWGCPNCQAPGIEDETRASQYFEFLSLILQTLVSREVMDLFETKLRDWHLQKDPNFRWCAHCAFGFLYDRPGVLGMQCPSCGEKTCFKCKIKWEPQHEGFSCEEYERWKMDNDPERQAKGVKLYLEENGIDCPSCKMRYSLAKGGCMHFKCPQCGHEFCSGCNQAFLHQGACKLLKSCNRGLHCHHPRDCYYYLRDYDVIELQRLLKNHKIVYNVEVPPDQQDKAHCQVMEQKEFGTQKKDEACGKDTGNGMGGLCENHYKEYLVSLINKNKLDTVSLLDIQKMKILIERNEKQPPKLLHNEGEKEYRRRLIQFIQKEWPLKR